MELGEIGNPGAADHGKPLDGVRVLAAEQMQALPFATQLMARLGADVVMKKEGVSTVGDDVVMKTSRRMMAFGQLAMTW